MVTTVNGITTPSVHPVPSLRPERKPRMLQTLGGYEIPAHVDQRTDLGDLPIAAGVYMRLNEGKTATDTVMNVFDAMRDANAVICLYVDTNGLAARVIWPDSISLTND